MDRDLSEEQHTRDCCKIVNHPCNPPQTVTSISSPRYKRFPPTPPTLHNTLCLLTILVVVTGSRGAEASLGALAEIMGVETSHEVAAIRLKTDPESAATGQSTVPVLVAVSAFMATLLTSQLA